MKAILWTATLCLLVGATAACPGGNSGDDGGDADTMAIGGSTPIPKTAGSISGVVKFTGTAPKPAMEDISGSDGCGAEEVKSEEVVVNPNQTLRYCIVYLDSKQVSQYKFQKPAGTVTVNQHGCVYHPHVTAVRTGQKFVFKNSDGALHNVHVLGKKNPEKNVASQAGSTTKPFKFRREEIIHVKCDVHPWMSSYIGVFPHPYAAVTNEKGEFKLENVPPGTYTLKVWQEKYHPAGKEQTIEVKLGDNEAKTVEVTVKG